jgi:glutamine amidotransferase
MIAIVDYGLGNVGSIRNMLKKIGCSSVIATSNAADVAKAEKLILPGVGAFDTGMQMIEDAGLLPVLNEQVTDRKKPILGICLGMQMMTRGSEEGIKEGLGWIDAETYRFDFADKHIKVPHMGWNTVRPSKLHKISKDISNETRFYFVHSYYVKCKQKEDELMQCHYGIDFTCAVQKDNIVGVQFHPEKSHRYGMQFLERFINGY